MTNIFELQSDKAKKIANALETILTNAEIGKIERKPTQSFEAYDYYLKARFHFITMICRDFLWSLEKTFIIRDICNPLRDLKEMINKKLLKASGQKGAGAKCHLKNILQSIK